MNVLCLITGIAAGKYFVLHKDTGKGKLSTKKQVLSRYCVTPQARGEKQWIREIA
ncbi:hypothetical protein SERLADRAFT_377249 [Serpula lacrymans var. lacrymans S7.9]|uniref:Uncharacterized protein n=1 Tax=Serpula lacrymans var. lacrymans (strain S7.9) TaxID=578457 RepID=F8NI47_SERL9|nr:uncharacterized protein SERLADRAFT_377249 [Serpula lacrymans var. lacrymans S7.9]EGO28944.1 hypothetical protein SERLADRAFT_377249 [Serpula lacrymans var. lacrymans S7.9]